MIKIQRTDLWSEEDHQTAPPYARFGRKKWGKWTTFPQPVLRHTYMISEWHRSFTEFRVGARLSSAASDDEVFRQAAAKVGHKIQIDRKILGGAPCVAGTRIPVYAILQLVEAGYTRKRILKSFPSLSREDLEAALRFSIIVMER